MKYLLYCIFGNGVPHETQGLAGVGGQPVFVVGNNGLSAAVSEIAPSDTTPNIPGILAYKKVIEAFHENLTVIPMRYGCLFERKAQITCLLEERQSHYQALLAELDGCVEMGIRVLISDLERYAARPKTHNAESVTPGRAYLAARKALYARNDEWERNMETIVVHYRNAVSGLFVKMKAEHYSPGNPTTPFRMPQPKIRNPKSAIQNPVFSLYFLVPRDSVDPFRKAFQRLSAKESAKLLLTGPWPPYNFVMVEDRRDQNWRLG